MDEINKLMIEYKKLNDKAEIKHEELEIMTTEYENMVRVCNCMLDKIRFLKRRTV